MDDYEVHHDVSCPECGHAPTHSRDCDDLFCQDGFKDQHEQDPINHPVEGEDLRLCNNCKGTGIEWWCPVCGADIDPDLIEYESILAKQAADHGELDGECSDCGTPKGYGHKIQCPHYTERY